MLRSLGLAWIVSGIHVIDREWPFGIDLNDTVRVRESEMIHVCREIDETASRQFFGLGFIKFIPHPDIEVT
jgi:hypothetical protein